MSKKTFALVTGITAGICTIASALVTYLQPAMAVQIVAGIGIAEGAVVEICNLFVK